MRNRRQSIQEYLGLPANWPVKENIKHTIVLMPSKQDIRRAVKKDPQACALHNAACRTFQVPNCAIGGRQAYIPQRDSNGRPYIAYVYATRATRAAIRKFDATGEMPKGGFVFRPATKSTRHKERAKYQRKWAKRKSSEQFAAGPSSPKPRRKKYRVAQRILRTLPHNLRAV